MTSAVQVGTVAIGGGNPLVLIAGPCVVEGASSTVKIALEIRRVAEERRIPFIFKASYDKANRTSHESFRGLGRDEGLRVLERVQREAGVPVTSDVHTVEEISAAAAVVDLIQIPAFLSRQTDLLVAAARSGKPMNVKKGQFLAPWDMRNVVAKIRAQGTPGAGPILTERGTCFGYNNLVSDMRALAILRSLGCPVVFDATHSVQMPGGAGDRSGGQREHVPLLARAAAAAGIDGLFLETHPDPDRALSDGPNSLALADLPRLLDAVQRLDAIARETGS